VAAAAGFGDRLGEIWEIILAAWVLQAGRLVLLAAAQRLRRRCSAGLVAVLAGAVSVFVAGLPAMAGRA
jgi:hypothetical protein